MNTEVLINQASKFLMNPILKNQRIHQLFNELIETLEQGESNDKENARILKVMLQYPGSDAAQEAAVFITKAINNQHGRRLFGLPIRVRGRKHKFKSTEARNDVLFEMILIQSNAGSREKIQLLIDQGINEDLSESVRAKLINAFNPVAIYGAKLHAHFNKAYKNKEDFLINPPVFCMDSIDGNDVKFFAVQQKSLR
jgi:uncharacterized membrane-anchored protein YjiN (DUF445 family)